MFKRPGEEQKNDDLDLEQNVKMKLRELLDKKKKQDLDGTSERTRGHATRVLRPRLKELREMVIYGLSMREITDLLGEGGVQINYHSLRGFLKKHLPREYAEYLEAGKSGDPYLGRNIPDDVIERDTPVEFKDPKAESKSGHQSAGTDNPAKVSEPAAKRMVTPMQSIKKRSNKAGALVEKYLDSDD